MKRVKMMRMRKNKLQELCFFDIAILPPAVESNAAGDF